MANFVVVGVADFEGTVAGFAGVWVLGADVWAFDTACPDLRVARFGAAAAGWATVNATTAPMAPMNSREDR